MLGQRVHRLHHTPTTEILVDIGIDNCSIASVEQARCEPSADLVVPHVVDLKRLALGGDGDAAGDVEMDGDEFDVGKTSKDREFYTQQRAEQVFAPFLNKGASYSQVRLSTKSFGIDAAKVASRAFVNLASTLKEVDLSDTIAGRPEVEAQGLKPLIN